MFGDPCVCPAGYVVGRPRPARPCRRRSSARGGVRSLGHVSIEHPPLACGQDAGGADVAGDVERGQWQPGLPPATPGRSGLTREAAEDKGFCGPDKLSAPARALLKLGLRRDIDLALHLPLRYEDETRAHADRRGARGRDRASARASCATAASSCAPRRQLVVRLADDSGELVLRFLHFYPSQQKTLALGQRVRVRGELRGGFFGREMVHPTCQGGRRRHAAGRPR